MSLATVEFHIKAMSLNEKWITLNNFLFDIIKRQGKIQGTYVASIVKTALEELLTLKVGKQILKNMSKGNYLESYLIESLEFEKLEIEPSAPNWYNDVKEAFPSKIREMIDGTEERKAWVFNVKNSIIKFETLIKIYTADGYFKENVSLGFLTILKRLMYEVSNSREIMVLKSTINELVDSMKPSVQKLKPSASLPLQIIVGELLSYLDLSLLKDVRGPEAIEAEKGSLYPFLKKL